MDHGASMLHLHLLQTLLPQVNRLPQRLSFLQVDSGLGDEVVVLKVPFLPGNRLVFAPTGPVNRDYDDVRRFSDAAGNGIKRLVRSCSECQAKSSLFGASRL